MGQETEPLEISEGAGLLFVASDRQRLTFARLQLQDLEQDIVNLNDHLRTMVKSLRKRHVPWEKIAQAAGKSVDELKEMVK